MLIAALSAVGQCFVHSKRFVAEVMMAKVSLEWKSVQVLTVYRRIVQEYHIFTELAEWKGEKYHQRISAVPELPLSLH